MNRMQALLRVNLKLAVFREHLRAMKAPVVARHAQVRIMLLSDERMARHKPVVGRRFGRSAAGTLGCMLTSGASYQRATTPPQDRRPGPGPRPVNAV